MFGRSAVLEKSAIAQCLETQADVGVYKWLPEYTWVDFAGATMYPGALAKAIKKNNKPAPCELVRQKEVIVVMLNGEVIGEIPDQAYAWWIKLFNQVGDENTRLVGEVTFREWETPDERHLVFAKGKMQCIRKLDKVAK